MSIEDQIQSVRQSLNRDYSKPSEDKLNKLREDLQNSEEALGYLHFRGLSQQTVEHFKLGYDVGKNAIAIPNFKNGQLVNIKYRFLSPEEGKAKYISERGAENWIYHEDGVQHALQKRGVLIVEGEMDLMSAWQAGIKNVVSPASGKDSYGVWIELLDNIPRIYIAYDNDEPGRTTGKKFAERLGTEKCYEVRYPDGIKDANEFFTKHTIEEYREIIKAATPYYSYQFKNVGDIISEIRSGEGQVIELDVIPGVKIEKDWLIVLSGVSNIGKTQHCLNIARELAQKNIPCLIFPFERGITSVGRRFLQVLLNKSTEDFRFTPDSEWDRIVTEVVDTPVYFSTPKREDITDIITKSRRLFDTKVVVIDHLDYIVRHTDNQTAAISNTLQDLKRLGEELGIIFIVVTHLRKIETPGAQERRKPGIEDLKGSSSLFQDPECVLLLYSDEPNTVTVKVAKNKGEMGEKKYGVNLSTGRMGEYIDDF